MSGASKSLLQMRYRDQLIRELEAVQARANVELSNEVVELMAAVAREKARVRETKHHWWRRFLPPAYVRRDDVLPTSDLYLLEATLIEHLETDELKIRVMGYRDLLSHLLTEDSYGKLSAALADLSVEPGAKAVLPEARALISRMYRRYEGVPAVEAIRSNTAKWIAGVAIIVILSIWMLIRSGLASNVLAMGAFGAAGAAVSTMGRLYSLDSRQEPFGMWLTLECGRLTLFLAPVVGAIFALVLAVFIRSGLLGGGLFPAADCWSLFDGFTGTCPSEQADLAKLFGWGFIAGWAERMVPDVIDRLAPQAVSSVKSK